jgi:regulator of RNase E activity RraA
MEGIESLTDWYMRLIDVGTDVTVAGLTVHPGDVLHGDEHGVQLRRVRH